MLLNVISIVNYRQALLAIYKYLNLLRAQPLTEHFFTEMQQLSEMQFRFQEKKAPDSYAQEITDYIKYPTPRELVLAGPKTIFKHGVEEVKQILETLTLERSRVVLMAQNHFDAGDGKSENNEVNWEKEPWYGTEYTVRRIEDDFAALVSSGVDLSDFGAFLHHFCLALRVLTDPPFYFFRHVHQMISRSCIFLGRTSSSRRTLRLIRRTSHR